MSYTKTKIHRKKLSKALKGIKRSEETKLKISLSKQGQCSGSNHYKWKEEGIGYRGIHHWVIKNKGLAIKCSNCGKEKTTSRSIQWANVNHKYKRILEDYIALCVKCHWSYDKQHNNK